MKKKKMSFFKNSKLHVALKVIASLWILYHLVAIFIIPHKSSLIHENLKKYFISYAQTLSFMVTWDFYAPYPSLYYYFEYEVISPKNKVETFRWPPSRKEFKSVYLNHNRLIYHARFFMLSGRKRIARNFIPYLCTLHPTAKEISLKAILENRPHFKKARMFKKGFFSQENKKNMQEWFTVSSKCKKRKNLRQIDSVDMAGEAYEEDFQNLQWEEEDINLYEMDTIDDL